MSTSKKLFLWDHPVSSYAQKVRIALREKNIAFDMKTPEGIGSGRSTSDFTSASLRTEVPALVVDGDLSIFDSKVILQYLEDAYPEPALAAPSPAQRAVAGMIQEVCDGPFEAANWAFMEVNMMKRAEGAERDAINAAIVRQVKEILAWLTARLGEREYFNGERFGLADLCVFPVLNRCVGNGYGPEEGSPLHGWYVRVKERPSVRQTGAEMEAALEEMAEVYKTGRGSFRPGGGARREYRDYRLEMMIKSGGLQVVLNGLKEETIRFNWPVVDT